MKLNKNLRLNMLLSCTSALGLLMAPTATAQTEPNVDEDTIIVTGTRVRGADPVGSDVISLGRKELDRSGAPTIDRMLKEIPQVYDLGVSENSRGQAGGNGNIVYGNSVNLRGIGPYATLVLIDGHRVVNNSRSIDPSILPSLGVERVEVVADGASAIYGSDAVAGVVNLIPRRSMDGAEVFGRYGFGDDFDEYQIGAAFGKTFDRGQFMVAYEHVDRSNLNGDDRDYYTSDQTAFGGEDYRVTRCAPGTIIADGVTYAIPEGGLTNASDLVAGTSNLCNGNIGQDLIPEQSYNTINGTFTFDVNDKISVFADGFYSKRDFLRRTAHSTATLAIPETNAFFVRPDGFTGSSYQIAYNFENDLPSNDSFGSAENWQISPGFNVELGDWNFEALISYGENSDASSSVTGLPRGLSGFLGSSDPTIAFDPYGLGRTSADTLAAMSNQIFIAPTSSEFVGYEATVDGTLFQIAGGDVGVAIGYEAQEIDVHLGLARGNPDAALRVRDFTRRVDSVFAEVQIPLISAANARPGIEELTVNAAVRYDNYDDVGSTTNPKFGVNYRPNSNVLLRASYGTSFRAPLISQIYGNSNAIFGQSYQNPAGGAPLLGFAQSGPNLDLGPETATTWSFGGEWDAADNLKFTATYFDVDYKNQVETYLADLAILSREADFAGSGIILRGAEAAARLSALLDAGIPLARGSFPGGDVNNVDLYVDGRNNNLGRSITRGIDFTANYTMETDDIGDFIFNLGGTYLTEYAVALNEDAPLVDRKNTLFFPLTFKARASVTWDMEPFTTRLTARHVNGFTNNAVTPNEDVNSYSVFDLSVFWDVGGSNADGALQGLTLGAELRNMFDQDPSYVNLAPGRNGSGGYDATTGNPIGRQFAVSLRKKW